MLHCRVTSLLYDVNRFYTDVRMNFYRPDRVLHEPPVRCHTPSEATDEFRKVLQHSIDEADVPFENAVIGGDWMQDAGEWEPAAATGRDRVEPFVDVYGNETL